MDRSSIYFRQVQLLVRILPLIAKETYFALKGGTAINLFVRNLPRLSVDIDLVYLPLDDRETAIRNALSGLQRIAKNIKTVVSGSSVVVSDINSDSLRLIVSYSDVKIKIELSPVLRGTIFPPVVMEVLEKVESEFGYAEIPVLAIPDLYAGKICAALDRQHPRDLFDIKLLLENEGITDYIRKAFLVYLISHSRPIVELILPSRKNIHDVYEGEFKHMTEIMVTVGELEEAREQLINSIHSGLTMAEKDFLISFKAKSPEWSLLGIKGIENLPAVRWKMLNLAKMSVDRHSKALAKLKEALQG